MEEMYLKNLQGEVQKRIQYLTQKIIKRVLSMDIIYTLSMKNFIIHCLIKKFLDIKIITSYI